MTLRITLLLPCHSLEDFPVHHQGDEAEGLLANWTAPWHPALIAATQQAPTWQPAEIEPENCSGTIILRPSVCKYSMSENFEERLAQAGATLLADRTDRDELVRELLQVADLPQAAFSDEIVSDFHALGYWYLQIELLTRQMRYTSNLDESRFRGQVLQAAQQAAAGDLTAARASLQVCFGMLSEQRDHYYPVDAFLLDLTLVTESTSELALVRELEHHTAVNLWITGSNLEQLAKRKPHIARRLKEAVAARQVGLIGGEYTESALPLQSAESLLCQLRRGLDAFQQVLEYRPRVFGRRRFGMTPFLPGLLNRMGYLAAMHATLDAGQFPESSQARTGWEGMGGAIIDTLGCIPVDATRPETFLKLALRMGESMELDHVATIVLAHWAGASSRWYDDLRRGAPYGLALGKFATVEDFFEQTSFSSQQDNFPIDKYRSPYLRQDVQQLQPHPISRWVRWWRMAAALEEARRFNVWSAMLGATREEFESLRAEIHQARAGVAFGQESDAWPDGRLIERLRHRSAERLSERLRHADSATATGRLVFNAGSHNRRAYLTLPGPADVPDSAAVYAAASDEVACRIAVDVPAAGFAWLPLGDVEHPPRSEGSHPNLVHDTVLRNEFCEAHVDPETGSLRAIYDFQTRGNRLSQRLVFGPPPQITVMQAEAIEIVHNDAILGQLRTRGRLLDGEKRELAGFQQTFSLWRGSRTVQISVGLQPREPLAGDPWNHYFACRWAWPREENTLYRAVQGVRYPTDAIRCEAPSYLEIEDGPRRTTLLTGGLPYHHRCGPRMLDSLLVVPGETEREFELGIGIDLRQPLDTALDQITPTLALACDQPRQSSGWLFHLNLRHVLATGWEAVWKSDDADSTDENTCAGFRVRLLETAGASGDINLRAPRPLVFAVRTDFLGNPAGDLQIKDGAVHVSIGPHEWTELECRW